MEQLLIGDAQQCKQPHRPPAQTDAMRPGLTPMTPSPQLHGHSVQVAQLQPGGVGASNEQVDHGPVAPVQQVPPRPGHCHWRGDKVMWRRVSAGSYPPLVTAATVWKTVDTEKSPVRTAPYTRLQYSWAAPGTCSVSRPGLGWVWCGYLWRWRP